MKQDDFQTFFEQCAQHLHQQRLSPKALHNEIARLRALANKAAEWGFMSLLEKTVPAPPPPCLNRAAIDEATMHIRVGALPDGPAKLAALLGTDGGGTLSQVAACRWRDVDWQERTIQLGKMRVQMTTRLEATLRSQQRQTGHVLTTCEGAKLSHGALSRLVGRLCRQLGLPQLTWHDLRRWRNPSGTKH